MWALYTFHWECRHSNPLEPALDIFQEIQLWANANNFQNWILVSFLFICMFCMNLSCASKSELWSDFKKKTKWGSCVKKTFVCESQTLCQFTREICMIYFFYQIMLTWAILGYLMPFLRPRSLLQSMPKSSVHPISVLLMVINQKGNLVYPSLYSAHVKVINYMQKVTEASYHLVHCCSAHRIKGKFHICESST